MSGSIVNRRQQKGIRTVRKPKKMKITPEEQVAKEASGGVKDDARTMKLMVREPAEGGGGGGEEGKKERKAEGKKTKGGEVAKRRSKREK